MLDLRTRLLEDPAKRQFDVLHQMTRKLDVSNVRRMIQRPNIIVLQDARRVEVVHKPLATALVQVAVVEVFDDVLDLLEEAGALLECIPDGTEARPQAQEDYLAIRPSFVDLVDQLDVAVVELGRGDVVGGVVVVRANVDDSDIGSWMSVEVPVGNVYGKSDIADGRDVTTTGRICTSVAQVCRRLVSADGDAAG